MYFSRGLPKTVSWPWAAALFVQPVAGFSCGCRAGRCGCRQAAGQAPVLLRLLLRFGPSWRRSVGGVLPAVAAARGALGQAAIDPAPTLAL